MILAATSRCPGGAPRRGGRQAPDPDGGAGGRGRGLPSGSERLASACALIEALGGASIDKDVRAADVGAGTVTTESLGAPVETLTLKFAPATGNATELVVEWEKTRVRIPIRRVSG